MRKVIVHAGFHKTATTTVQSFFRENQDLLSPYCFSPPAARFERVRLAARRYSDDFGNHNLLEDFRQKFTKFYRHTLNRDVEYFVISSEELSGHLPGRKRVKDYRAAFELMPVIEGALLDLNAHQDITFYYSTRDPNEWLESAYWQHVKSSVLMTMSKRRFLLKYRKAKRFDPIIETLRARLNSPVVTANIDDFSDAQFGPATPLLDLMDVPQAILDQCQMPKSKNKRLPQSVSLSLLEVNKKGYTADETRRIKEEIIAQHFARS